MEKKSRSPSPRAGKRAGRAGSPRSAAKNRAAAVKEEKTSLICVPLTVPARRPSPTMRPKSARAAAKPRSARAAAKPRSPRAGAMQCAPQAARKAAKKPNSPRRKSPAMKKHCDDVGDSFDESN